MALGSSDSSAESTGDFIAASHLSLSSLMYIFQLFLFSSNLGVLSQIYSYSSYFINFRCIFFIKTKLENTYNSFLSCHILLENLD